MPQIVFSDPLQVDLVLVSVLLEHVYRKSQDLCGIDYDKSVYSWNKVLVFNLGFDAKGPERTNCWMYIPESRYVFYRVGFYDNIIGQDRMSLYVEIGFAKDQPVGDIDTLLSRTLDDLRAAGILTEQQLIAEHHVLMDPAYVHITRRSEEDKIEKMNLLAQHDIYSIGRYGAWKSYRTYNRGKRRRKHSPRG